MTTRLTAFAKSMRENPTDAENLLWQRLRSRQIEGVKLRRQQPIDNFIVDFVTFERRVVVELDGEQHADNAAHDSLRDQHLRASGFTVLRFWNSEVLQNIEGVLEAIRQECLK